MNAQVSKENGMPWIIWVCGCMSLFDAVLLAGKFESIKQEGHAENAQSNGPWTTDHRQRNGLHNKSKCHKDCRRNPNGGRNEFNPAHSDMTEPDAEEGSYRGDEAKQVHAVSPCGLRSVRMTVKIHAPYLP